MPNEFVVKNGFISQNSSTITGSLIVSNSLDTSQYLLIYNGQTSVDWKSKILTDSTNNTSVDWDTKQLVDSNLYPTVDWGVANLNDSTGVLSVDWANRKTYDSAGVKYSIDWNNRQLLFDSTPILDWNNSTGSFIGTSSWATNAVTASFLPVGTYAITSSWAVSASRALTASFLPIGTYAITSSWAQSASNAINAQTASFLPVGTYAITSSWDVSASQALTASHAPSYAPLAAPTFITYSGGNQATTSINFATVHSSAGFSNIAVGFYQYEFFINYDSAATATGARFGLSGSAGFDYLGGVVNYTVLIGDRSGGQFRTYDGGAAAPSSVSTTGNGGSIQGAINVTSTGDLLLRYSTEVNASAITVTGVFGYLKRLY